MATLYAPQVIRWGLRSGIRLEDAADIVQEVFRTVAARIAEFRRDSPEDTFRGWLWTITRHKLGDHIRRRRMQPEGVGGSDALGRLHNIAEVTESSTSGSEAPGGAAALCRQALEAIRGEFGERTWQAFWRHAVEDRSGVEVAAELGMTPNAVYLAKARVLRRLRDELGDLEP